MKLLADAVFPEDELQLYKQNNKQRLEVSLKKSEFVAGRLIDEYVFGIDHPYGKYSTADSVRCACQRPQLQSFYQAAITSKANTSFLLPANFPKTLKRN